MERGRPSIYTQEIADKICEQLAAGKTLREVCRQEGMPDESAVRKWVLENREGFSPQYAQAREIGYQAMADELLEIADDGQNDWMERNGQDDEGWQANGEHLQRSRLRVDTRKWLLAKALPKVYGDRLLHGNDPDNPMPPGQTVTVHMTPEQAAAAYAAQIDPDDEA